jgi:hypothetical protein
MVGATVGISRPSQRDLPRDFAQYATAGRFWQIFIQPDPAVKVRYANGRPKIAQIANTRQWISGRVVAKSARSGGPVFTSMDALLYGPLLLRQAIFKWKKVLAAISLGIISMGSSCPRSRDTVPLNMYFCHLEILQQIYS